MAKFKQLPNHTGTSHTPYGVYSRDSTTGYDSLEVSLPGRHGPFQSTHVVEDGGYMVGFATSGYSWEEWPSNWRLWGEHPFAPLEDISIPSWGYLSTKLYADTNPSKPSFDALRAIGELKDLPHQLKSIGDSFLNKGYAYAFGHVNLSYQFGWLPFLKDIVSMITCQGLVAKRFDQLRNMKKNGSEIRKRTLFKKTVSSADSYVNTYWKCRCSVEVEEEIWGYTIWKPQDDFPSTDAALFQLARQCALGLNIARPKLVWDLMPWTWLIDWFANAGDVLQSVDNTAKCYCAVACICHKSTNTWRSDPIEQVDKNPTLFVSLTDQVHKTVHKSRGYADPPTFTAQLPVLTDSQLGILGSIGATRR